MTPFMMTPLIVAAVLQLRAEVAATWGRVRRRPAAVERPAVTVLAEPPPAVRLPTEGERSRRRAA